MTDATIPVMNAILKRFKDNGDGTYSELVSAIIMGTDEFPVPTGRSNDPITTINTAQTLTQTVQALAANTVFTLAANASRKHLSWMVTGVNDVTVAPGSSVTVGNGKVYGAAAAAGKQGGAGSIDGPMTTQALSFIAAAASTIVIWEGQ